jgi:hypothetical protein
MRWRKIKALYAVNLLIFVVKKTIKFERIERRNVGRRYKFYFQFDGKAWIRPRIRIRTRIEVNCKLPSA